MKSNNIVLLFLVFALATSCGGGGGGSGTVSGATPNPTLTSIEVTPSNPSIALTTSQQFAALGNYPGNIMQDLTTAVTWSSSAASVAMISNANGSQGLVTSGSTGMAAVSATLGSIKGSTIVTVTTAALVSITVTPANPIISPVTPVTGTTQQFTAVGTYSNNVEQDLTTAVTWSSSAPSVATISNANGSQGLVTSGLTGTSTITATSGNISGITTMTVPSGNATNVLPITVNGALCAASTSVGFLNKPCVSVTICNPGTLTCQTINDILMDTGSFGLRIFKSVLNPGITLTPIASGPGSLAECVQFGDGSSEWGPVQMASIILASEPSVTVPVHVIDQTFGGAGVPPACSGALAITNPGNAGFNGILGVGVFSQDCGPACASIAGNGEYYSCNGSSCTGTVVALSNQVQNPVALLPQDNNGVIVQLPAVPRSGSSSVNGSLVLGIGTQSNNIPPGVTTYAADSVGEIITILNGVVYSSFLDTGSNGLFFTSPSAALIPNCAAPDSAWFCPTFPTIFSITNESASGSPSGAVAITIGNFDSLAYSSNSVFNDISGSLPGLFDMGLPFHFGRNIYVGIDGKGSTLGIGPYWAY